MKFLFAGGQSEERLKALLSLSKITSESIIEGLNWHLVRGHTIEAASVLAGVKKNNLSRAVDTLNDVAEKVEDIKEIDRIL